MPRWSSPALASLALLASSAAPAQDVALTTFSAPSQVTQGQPVTVSATVRNDGPGNAEAFVVIRIGDGPTYDLQDPVLCYLPSVSQNWSLAEGASDSASNDCLFPTYTHPPPQVTHLNARLVRLDATGPNQATTTRSQPIALTPTAPQGPDLVAVGLNAPSTAVAGEGFGASVAIRNDGDDPSDPTSARVLLGSGAFDPSDPVLCSVSVPTITPKGSTAVVPNACAIPSSTPPGAYALYAQVNHTGASPDVNPGNEITSASVEVLPGSGGPADPTPAADLVVSSASPPDSVAPGDSFDLPVTLRNLGTVDAVGVTTVARWSDSDAEGSASAEIGREEGTFLPGTSSPTPIPLPVTIPAGAQPGVAYLHLTVDDPGLVPESREDNNTRVVPVTVRQADLPDTADSAVLSDTGELDGPRAPQTPPDPDAAEAPDTVEFGCQCGLRQGSAPSPVALLPLILAAWRRRTGATPAPQRKHRS